MFPFDLAFTARVSSNLSKDELIPEPFGDDDDGNVFLLTLRMLIPPKPDLVSAWYAFARRASFAVFFLGGRIEGSDRIALVSVNCVGDLAFRGRPGKDDTFVLKLVGATPDELSFAWSTLRGSFCLMFLPRDGLGVGGASCSNCVMTKSEVDDEDASGEGSVDSCVRCLRWVSRDVDAQLRE